MKITFIGAAHEVTGSCHLVEACGKKFLIDCGMEQGPNLYENVEIPVNIGEIDYIFITHAHIDHTGLLPLMYAKGFKGQIYTTHATKDLCEIMLRDSAHIQQFEAEWRNRKAKRKGLPEYTPLYSVEDAYNVMRLFVGCNYKAKIQIAEGITASFTDIGHLIGSAAITFELTEDGTTQTVVFSGDVGNTNQPLIRNPQKVPKADVLLIESTYGGRSHGERPDYIASLVEILRETFKAGGNVVIPSFAVGRTQEMLYFFREIKQKHLLPEYAGFEVYVDSPLAVSATQVFVKNEYECYDEETMALVKQGINPIGFPGLKLSVTSDESKAINFDMAPKVILSASGMCDAGRIKHHLKHNLWRPECTVLFVGYQAVGTVGRSIVEGADHVTLFGEEVAVRAKIRKLSGISGHADEQGLLNWLGEFDEKPKQVYVVHGEDAVTDAFAAKITETYGISALAPYSGDSFDLVTGKQLAFSDRKRFEKSRKSIPGMAASMANASAIYRKLVAAGERLLSIIHKSSQVDNKDLTKFTEEVTSLCDRWDIK